MSVSFTSIQNSKKNSSKLKLRSIRKKRWPKILLIILAVFILIMISAVVYIDMSFYSSNNKNQEEKVFSVSEGMGNLDIAHKLSGEGFIKNYWSFVIYTKYKGISSKMKVGKYSIAPGMNVAEIADLISSGKQKEYEVTILEGLNLDEIAKHFEEQKIVSAKDFLDACNKKYDFDFLKDKPNKNSLEGFIFPDTYTIKVDTSASDIVETMLSNFDKKLTPDMRDQMKRNNMTIYDTVIMASIVEKEVNTDEDRKIVAGIFYKRLNEDMSLQSDVTLKFALKTNKTTFSIEDTKVASPYNTYQNKGLPPGPICNPGLSSIMAAIYPQKTDYLYFLADKNGQTIYAKTYEEQLKNQEKYLE